MSNDLLSSILGAVGPQVMQQMAGKVGASPQQTQNAIGAALPLILGAMSKNASQASGADALHGALSRNHSGLDINSVLGSVMGGGGAGDKILGHVLGARQNAAASGVSQASGLDKGQAAQVMAMLAPVVMGVLGKQTQQQGLNPQALAGMLGQQSQSMNQGGGITSVLMNAVLDKDGDGDVDLADMMAMASGKSSQQDGAGGLLGKLFGK
jgi:hypothetical protein